MGTWSDETPGLVILPDGRRLRGRSLRLGAPSDEVPELGIYLTARRYEATQWPSIWIPWPDFGLPVHRSEVVDALRHAHRRALDHRVEIACRGGWGRTGTAMAILARLAGVPSPQAVAWTRAHYSAKAVETPWQRRFASHARLHHRE